MKEEELLLIKNAHDRKIAEIKDLNSANRMLFQSIIDFATLSIKSSIMINGGAAVSLLAFFGNVWKDSSLNVCLIVNSLICFACGTFCACLGAGLAYLAQCNFLYDKEPYRWGNGLRYAAICSVLFSYGLFLYGVYVISKIV